MHALKALAATEWERAASLATWALATLSSYVPVDEIASTQFAWTAHTIMGRCAPYYLQRRPEINCARMQATDSHQHDCVCHLKIEDICPILTELGILFTASDS